MKKKREWGIITAPIVCFVVLALAPWWPTVWLVWMGISNIWLVLTIGWAISWYVGLAFWADDYKKRKENKNTGV